jgi:SHS2 domain-containing protein
MNKQILAIIGIVLFLTPLVLAVDSNLYSAERQDSIDKIGFARDKIDEMKQLGFTTTRLEDEFSILRQTQENNLFKINNKQVPDFAQFNLRYSEIEQTISNAYQVKDELDALKKAIDEVSKEINTNEAKDMFLEAEKEFIDERYEFATKKIDATYEKIIELQGVQAKANAAYEATRKNLVNFLIDYQIQIGLIIIIPLIVYLLFRKQFNLNSLNGKINNNKFEVEVLKNEIKKAQEIYFVEGKIPEGEYSIKVKLYGDKIRELNRNIALLEEEKEKLLNKKSKK